MKSVTLRVGSLETSLADFKRIWETGEPEPPSINFVSWDIMHKILSPKRLEIIKALCGQGPMSIRELARRLGRDFKAVHTDVVSLIGAGLIDQDAGKICFPYDRIHVEFDIDAAA